MNPYFHQQYQSFHTPPMTALSLMRELSENQSPPVSNIYSGPAVSPIDNPQTARITACAVKNCGRQDASRYYSNPDGSDSEVCRRCYDYMRKIKKAEAAIQQPIVESVNKVAVCAIGGCTGPEIKNWHPNPLKEHFSDLDDAANLVCERCHTLVSRNRQAVETIAKAAAETRQKSNKGMLTAAQKAEINAERVLTSAERLTKAAEKAAEIAEQAAKRAAMAKNVCVIGGCTGFQVRKWHIDPSDPNLMTCTSCFNRAAKQKEQSLAKKRKRAEQPAAKAFKPLRIERRPITPEAAAAEAFARTFAEEIARSSISFNVPEMIISYPYPPLPVLHPPSLPAEESAALALLEMAGGEINPRQ